MLLYAHRGASQDAPENTLSAFREALRQGADGIEFDVQLTRDGVPVVFHDATLERTTQAKGFVYEWEWEDLTRLDAGSWFSADFRDERIPSLEEVLRWVRMTGLRLNVELKNESGRFDRLSLGKIVDLLRKYDLVERTVVSSFDHALLAVLAREFPELRRGALCFARLYRPEVYAEALGADLHPFFLGVTSDLVSALHARGRAVRPFPVNDGSLARSFAAMGVDAVITDRPGELRSSLEERG
ncbi:MAG: Glycerophosphoryl diester phosphodiesterase [Brockia lithotrophica]|uniref:Glycerophosphoryl diester phosphodiesterase n=1 Tax=Brockia lithotrophica TaxID=933949 RepID=A0A2T5G967_9BACL|nr:MAG: Glycerophosphoryl diester phosphodiesterase [Brockia lithotrophica]